MQLPQKNVSNLDHSVVKGGCDSYLKIFCNRKGFSTPQENGSHLKELLLSAAAKFQWNCLKNLLCTLEMPIKARMNSYLNSLWVHAIKQLNTYTILKNVHALFAMSPNKVLLRGLKSALLQRNHFVSESGIFKTSIYYMQSLWNRSSVLWERSLTTIVRERWEAWIESAVSKNPICASIKYGYRLYWFEIVWWESLRCFEKT